MEKTARKCRCWACGSLDVIRWGKRLGAQRYFCKNCGIMFTETHDVVSKTNCIIWSKKWVLHRQTHDYLSQESGYSERILKYKFHEYLEGYPTWTNPSIKTIKEAYSAYIAIKNALPNMFHYLDDPKIPRTTNCIESYFSHLKEDIAIHRGLSKEHFRNFLRWYIYFKNTER